MNDRGRSRLRAKPRAAPLSPSPRPLLSFLHPDSSGVPRVRSRRGSGPMRDPMTWSIPLFRAFGIQVKLHILYIVITLGMLLRVYQQTGSKGHLAEFALIWVVMLFVIVLCH